MRYKKAIILIVCSLFLFTSTFGCIDGPAAGEPPPYTPNTDYQSDIESKPVEEMFHGFNIVSSDSTALVYDNITKKTVTFDSLVKRELDIFVEDLLTRFNAVYGYGLGLESDKESTIYNEEDTDRIRNNVLIENNGEFGFKAINDNAESEGEEGSVNRHIVLEDGDNRYKIAIDKRDLLLQGTRTGSDEAVTYDGQTLGTNGSIYNIADYAKNLTDGFWLDSTLVGLNFNLRNAIQGGIYYGAGGFSNENLLKEVSITLGIYKNDVYVSYILLSGPLTQANLKNHIDSSTFSVGDMLSLKIEGNDAGKFSDGTISKALTPGDIGGADVIYTLNNPIYNYEDFTWVVSQDSIATKESELKERIKLAFARILATGNYNSTLTLAKCVSDIDHLGILASLGEHPAEREKILQYIYKEIIGDKAVQKDNELLTDLRTSLGESGLVTGSSTINNAAHYYKGYELLIPTILDCATMNAFSIVSEEENIRDGITFSEVYAKTYLTDYPLYPHLPRVKNSNIKFSDLYPEGGEVSDIFWMPDYEQIRNVTFMAKEDVPIIELWTAFETKYVDGDGNTRMDVTVDLQINFTYVVGGQKILDNVRGYSGVGNSNTVTVTAGVYDVFDNDNSADFNIIDLLEAEHKKKLMGSYDGKTPDILSLYGSPYLVYANDSGVGSTVVIDAGTNYLQMSITVLSAYIVGERENVEMDRDNVYLKLGIFDPWY